MAQFSPDGRYIAYVSNKSGRNQVYVRPFPSGDRFWQISRDGGTEPLWSPDGRELFYRKGDAVMSVDIDLTGEFRPGSGRQLFEGPFVPGEISKNYDMDLEGQRFLMVEGRADPPTEVRLILNWFTELDQLGSELTER